MPSKTQTKTARISKITGKPVRPYNRKAPSPGHREMVITTDPLTPVQPTQPTSLAVYRDRADAAEVVVSANYRDRNSPYRWIVRKIGDPLSLGVAVKRVICPNPVAVVSSRDDGSQGESGWGCNILARTIGVVVDGVLPVKDSPWHPSYDKTKDRKGQGKTKEPSLSPLPAAVSADLAPVRFNGAYLEFRNVNESETRLRSAAGMVMVETGRTLALKPSNREIEAGDLKSLTQYNRRLG